MERSSRVQKGLFDGYLDPKRPHAGAYDEIDRYAEYLGWTDYVPRNRELTAVARELRKGRRRSTRCSRWPSGCTTS